MNRRALLSCVLVLGAGTSAPSQDAMPASHESTPTRWLLRLDESPPDLAALRTVVRTADAAATGAWIEARREATFVQRAGLLAALRSRAPAVRVDDSFWLVPAVAVTAPAALRDVLASLPGVRAVERDVAWLPCGLESAPVPVLATATDAMHHAADVVQAAGEYGAGATLAVLDSGQDAPTGLLARPHRIYYPRGVLGMAPRLLANVSLGAFGPDDPTGHGTAVTAIAAGGGWTSPAADLGHAPEASIVGYGIADVLPSGAANASTLIAAWQQVVADQPTYGIDVVLNAYEGSPDPTDLVQQALDAAVLAADVVVCVPAGNDPMGTQSSQSAANGLAVGAVDAGRRVLMSSSRGPLAGEPTRTYPDLAAHGQQVITALVDDETNDALLQGTSAASAQVAGAALLYRSIKPAASALEVKAALLATAEDIAMQNPGAGPNDLGVGYLRDDLLVDVASGNAFVASEVLTWRRQSLTYRVAVTPGVAHTAALAWHRHDVAAHDWSDLQLVVRDSNGVLATSSSPRNLYEVVRFVSNDAVVAIDVVGDDIECPTLEVSLVLPKGGPGNLPSVRNEFGAGCQGNCPNVNPKGDKLRNETVPTPRRYAVRMAGAAVTTDGYWICAALPAATSPIAFNAELWSDVAGAPGSVLTKTVGTSTYNAQGTISVPFVTPAWHQCTFPTSFTLSSGAFYWVIMDVPPGVILPTLVAGTTSPHLWEPLPATSTWPNSDSAPWAIQLHCPDAAGDIDILGLELPYVGEPFPLQLVRGPTAAPAFLSLGASATATGPGLALPLPLGVIGAPNCTLYTSIDVVVGDVTNQSGNAEVVVPLPPGPALAGQTVYASWLVVDPSANALGLLATTSLTCVIGSP